MQNSKEARKVNMGLLVPKAVVELPMDHNKALNHAYNGYGLYHTSDDHVLVVDDRGQRYDLNGQSGEVYSARFAGNTWAWNNEPLLSGKYSLRAQDYSFMVVYIKHGGLDRRLTRGQHTMMALGYDLPGFNRVLASGVDVSDIVVNHKNNCGYDNRCTNLEWCSQNDNKVHARYVYLALFLNPAMAQDEGPCYLRHGVQACTLRFALTLYKVLGMDGGAMENVLSSQNSYNIKELLADPRTMPEVRTACQLFYKADYVSCEYVTRDFIEKFDRYKNITIVF